MNYAASVIKSIRLKLELTQKEFARELGVARSTVQRWERGKFSPSPLAFEKLVKVQREIKNCKERTAKKKAEKIVTYILKAKESTTEEQDGVVEVLTKPPHPEYH